MSQLRSAMLVVVAVGLAACGGGGLPLADPSVMQHGFSGLVYGTSANDVWWPNGCAAGPSFWHWNGGSWTKVVAAGVECSGSGTGLFAVAGANRLWWAANQRLVTFDAAGSVEEHDLGLTGSESISGVSSFKGFTVVQVTSADAKGVQRATPRQSSGGAFTALPSPASGAATTLMVNGTDDVWSFAYPSTTIDPAAGAVEGPAHWSAGHWSATRGPTDPFGPGFPSNDLWVLGDVSAELNLWHFDGTTWGRLTEPFPKFTREGSPSDWKVARGTDGSLVVVAQVGKLTTESVRGLDATIYAWRWTKSGWSEPQTIATRYVPACSDSVCGVRVTGSLEDGTLVWAEVSTDSALLKTYRP